MSSSSLIRTLALGDKNKPYVAILHPNFLKTSSITVAKPIFFPTPLQWGCIYATSLFIGCIKNIIILLTTFSLYFDSPSSHYSFFPFLLSPTPLRPSHFSIFVSSLFISLFSISHSSLSISLILFSLSRSPSLRISDCWFGSGVLVMELNQWPYLVVADWRGSRGLWALGLIDVSGFWRSVLGHGIWLDVVGGDSMVGLAVAMGVDLDGCLWFCGYWNFV